MSKEETKKDISEVSNVQVLQNLLTTIRILQSTVQKNTEYRNLPATFRLIRSFEFNRLAISQDVEQALDRIGAYLTKFVNFGRDKLPTIVVRLESVRDKIDSREWATMPDSRQINVYNQEIDYLKRLYQRYQELLTKYRKDIVKLDKDKLGKFVRGFYSLTAWLGYLKGKLSMKNFDVLPYMELVDSDIKQITKFKYLVNLIGFVYEKL